MTAERELIPAAPTASPAGEESDLGPDPAMHHPDAEKDSEAALKEETSAKEEPQQEDGEGRGEKRRGESECDEDGLAVVREAKKRKLCGAALEKLSSPVVTDQLGLAGRGCGGGGFSFSFDARGFAPVETTPKFGSFNSSPADLELWPRSSGIEAAETGGEIKENDAGINAEKSQDVSE